MVIGILGLFVFAIGVMDMLEHDRDTDLGLMFAISLASIVVFGGLAVVKFQYARELESPSLYKDGVCSLIGTFLSAAMLLTTAVIDYAPGAWYIDPVASLIIGASAVVYGFRIIVKRARNGERIFSYDWWVSKEEDVGGQELPDVEEAKVAEEKEKATEHEVI